jgi:hypothetical protein
LPIEASLQLYALKKVQGTLFSRQLQNPNKSSDIIYISNSKLRDSKPQITQSSLAMPKTLISSMAIQTENFENRNATEIFLHNENTRLLQEKNNSEEEIAKMNKITALQSKTIEELSEQIALIKTERDALTEDNIELSQSCKGGINGNNAELYKALQQMSLIVLFKQKEELGQRSFELIRNAFSVHFVKIVEIYKKAISTAQLKIQLFSQMGIQIVNL